MLQIIGWLSSALLLATLVNQVYKQWSEGTSKGVSKWLFIGQLVVVLIYEWGIGALDIGVDGKKILRRYKELVGWKY